MSAPSLYRVTFVEWVLYEHTLSANSEEDALAQVQDILCNIGPEDFRIRDNGTEEWTAIPIPA